MTIQRSCLQSIFQFFLSFYFFFQFSLSQPVDFPQISNITSPTSIDNSMQKSKIYLICNINQYFDNEEGRCSGVPGGGKAIQIDRTKLCPESDTLSAHCKNPRYYYICKEDKIILAECADGTHFDSRFQRCVFVEPEVFDSSIISPEDMPYRQRINLPECRRPGRFPLANNCALFYVCATNGHRLHQNAFKCPNGTGFSIEEKDCLPMPDCKSENNISDSLCLLNTKDENIQLEAAPKAYIDESLYAVDNSWSTTTVSPHEYSTEKMTPFSALNFQELTTIPTSVQDTTEAIPIEPTTESSTFTSENYERLARSMVKDQSSTVSPITDSFKDDSMTTESDTLETSTQYTSTFIDIDQRQTSVDSSDQNTEKVNTMTMTTPIPLSTEDPITSSTPIESSETTEMNSDQTDLSLTTSGYDFEQILISSSTMSPIDDEQLFISSSTMNPIDDEQFFISSSTISPIDEVTFSTEFLKEESLSTPFISTTGTTNSPITQ